MDTKAERRPRKKKEDVVTSGTFATAATGAKLVL
jgi:hypothetical protein